MSPEKQKCHEIYPLKPQLPQIKTIIAEEEKMNEHLSADASIHISLSNRQWVTFTQGVGPLTNPTLEDFDVTTDDCSDRGEVRLVNGGEHGAGNGWGW